MATYADARLAKRAATDFLRDVPEVRSFGIAVIGDGDFGVKLNLSGPVAISLPQTICGGVPLVVDYVDHVTPAQMVGDGKWRTMNVNTQAPRPFILFRVTKGKTEYHRSASEGVIRYGYVSARRKCKQLNGATNAD